MEKTSLGFTGEMVSPLCLGTMFYGTKVSQEIAFGLLDQYFESDGNFIDTANIYAWWVSGFSGGESETLVGKWINERKIRKEIFLASKVGFDYGSVMRELKHTTIIAECEKSLRRLGIETIDLYYAHVDDRNTEFDEVLEGFTRLINSGKIRYIGASNIQAWRLEHARWVSKIQNLAEYCCVQQRYTYFQPRAGTKFETQVVANDDLLEYCKNRNVSLLAYSPLLKGAYVRTDRSLYSQYRSDDNQKRLAVLKAVADEISATINQVVLAWMLHSKPQVLPVFSASTNEQLKENLDSWQIKLSDEQFNRLQNVVNS